MRHAKVLVALSVSWFLLHGSRNEWNSDICWCVRTETLAPLCDDDPCQDDEVVLPPEGAAATMTVCENDSPKSEWTEKSMRSPDSMSNHEGHVIESPDSMLWTGTRPPHQLLPCSQLGLISNWLVREAWKVLSWMKLQRVHVLRIYIHIYIYIYLYMNRYMPCLSVIEGSIYIFYSKYYNEAIQATQSSIYIYIYISIYIFIYE